MILCNTCGDPLEVGTSLCATCGAQARPHHETTQRNPLPSINGATTEVLPSPRSEVRRNSSPLLTYIIIVLLALIAGGGIVALLRVGVKETSTAELAASISPNVSNTSSASPVSSPTPKSETKAERNPAANASAPSPATQPARAISGTWFVILGSFPKNDYDKANQLLQYLKGLGYDANIVDADSYPGLRDGLWALVMGPYSKSYAVNIVAQMKSVRSDAYVKSGW